ncbi:hypothetical protein ACFLY0_00660 [Patescibacteria group bacterium]
MSQVCKESQAKESVILRFVRSILQWVYEVTHPPQHIRINGSGYSFGECLRDLEEGAGLPRYDLSIDKRNVPMRIAAWPTGHSGSKYNISSKTSKKWKTSGRDGYIGGSIIEPDTDLGLGEKVFVGNIHISKNCPGVFANGVCTSCGDTD